MTLGSLVLVRRRAVGNGRLLRHELVHVEQWRRLGFVGFATRYLGAYLWWRLHAHRHVDAYRRIPLEVDAEWRARTGRDDRLGGRPSPLEDAGELGVRAGRALIASGDWDL